MITAPKFKPGQFATILHYVKPIFPVGTVVRIESALRGIGCHTRYFCYEMDGDKSGWVDQEDLE
jgi:hypothetical protein